MYYKSLYGFKIERTIISNLYGFDIELKTSLFPLKSYNKASNLTWCTLFFFLVLRKAIRAIDRSNKNRGKAFRSTKR